MYSEETYRNVLTVGRRCASMGIKNEIGLPTEARAMGHRGTDVSGADLSSRRTIEHETRPVTGTGPVRPEHDALQRPRHPAVVAGSLHVQAAVRTPLSGGDGVSDRIHVQPRNLQKVLDSREGMCHSVTYEHTHHIDTPAAPAALPVPSGSGHGSSASGSGS